MFGLGGCLLFALCAARRRPHHSTKTERQKSLFWASCTLLTLCGWALWQTATPIPLAHAATQVIRLIDCAVLGFSLRCAVRRLAFS